jgi:hypothetical protein
MTRMANEYERADHDRDLRKHDTDPLPLRLQPVVPDALAIALLVKGLANVADAASLIEQYAQTVASQARLEGVITASDRILAAIGGDNA